MQFLGMFLLAGLIFEVLSIVVMTKLIGGLGTVALMILSFFIGLWLLRRNAGISKVMVAGELLRNQGQMSVYQMLWPIRIPMAGFLLMVPGFVSSAVALLLLLPFKGKPIAQTSGTQQFSGAFGGFTRSGKPQDDDIIEGDFVVRPNSQSDVQSPKHLEDKR